MTAPVAPNGVPGPLPWGSCRVCCSPTAAAHRPTRGTTVAPGEVRYYCGRCVRLGRVTGWRPVYRLTWWRNRRGTTDYDDRGFDR